MSYFITRILLTYKDGRRDSIVPNKPIKVENIESFKKSLKTEEIEQILLTYEEE